MSGKINLDEFNEREQAEVECACVYVLDFEHGTSGHLAYSTIFKLFQLLPPDTRYALSSSAAQRIERHNAGVSKIGGIIRKAGEAKRGNGG